MTAGTLFPILTTQYLKESLAIISCVDLKKSAVYILDCFVNGKVFYLPHCAVQFFS
jgi:hypothetical protein